MAKWNILFSHKINGRNHCKPGVVLLLLRHTRLAPPKVRTPHATRSLLVISIKVIIGSQLSFVCTIWIIMNFPGVATMGGWAQRLLSSLMTADTMIILIMITWITIILNMTILILVGVATMEDSTQLHFHPSWYRLDIRSDQNLSLVDAFLVTLLQFHHSLHFYA